MSTSTYSVGTMLRIAFFLSLVVLLGIGCQMRQQTLIVEKPVVSTQPVVDLVVSVDALDRDRAHARARLLSVDGERNEAILPTLDGIEVGLLVRITGTRDLASRVVQVEQMQEVDVQDVFLISPNEGATVTSPLIVTGFTRTADITWTIFENEEPISSARTQLAHPEPGFFTPFSLEIFLPRIETETFRFTVGTDARTVALLSTQTSDFDIVLQKQSCSDFVTVSRSIAQTAALSRAALLELFAGPTLAEQQQGLQSAIPKEAVITRFSIEQGIATIELGPEGLSPGRCGAQALMDQIRKTMTQFEEISDVSVYLP